MRPSLWLTPLLPLLFTACSSIPKGADESVVQCYAPHNDPYTLEGARVDGDTLEVDVSYTGGCKSHDFYTCWPGHWQENDPTVFSEANPPRFDVELGHDAHGDSCDMVVDVETYAFDLSGMRDVYQAGHDNGATRLIVVIDDLSVDYPF